MLKLYSAVAMTQIKSIDEFFCQRVEVTKLFEYADRGFKWFIPQHVGSEYQNFYWTWVERLNNPDISWYEFREKFLVNGDDGVYAARKLTYPELVFRTMNLLGREKFIKSENREKYKNDLCSVAEKITLKLSQFKTNH